MPLPHRLTPAAADRFRPPAFSAGSSAEPAHLPSPSPSPLRPCSTHSSP